MTYLDIITKIGDEIQVPFSRMTLESDYVVYR
jgi:hypothetical protein